MNVLLGELGLRIRRFSMRVPAFRAAILSTRHFRHTKHNPEVAGFFKMYSPMAPQTVQVSNPGMCCLRSMITRSLRLTRRTSK